jgi:rhamnose transport system ATP-binding protein
VPVSLQFHGIDKSFGAVHALRGVSFEVAAGTAHALVGENGAGKSTLLKILAGLVAPDAGVIRWHGAPLAPASPRDAIEQGIGMVYQEMLCFPNLSVTANIFAGREICRGGLLDEPAMRARTAAVLDRLSLALDPEAPAETLSAAHRQLLQVARALAFDCRILVLDEPTTALTDAEADHLFEVLRGLRAHGTTLLYVSHRLPEVFRLCDHLTVLRDGAHVGTWPRDEVTPADIVRAMVGRDLEPRAAAPRPAHATAPALGLARLTRRPHFHDVSLSVAPGEIVGLFGLVGSGRTEVLETVFGLHRPHGGGVEVGGAPVSFASPREAARAGLALVPEERHRQGLFFNLSVHHNLAIPQATLDGGLVVREDAERTTTGALVAGWRIKAGGLDSAPESLSGGNQQKVVMAKWLATHPRVLLLDEPTKGVDVGAKFEIHDLVRRRAEDGLAVLVVSSDLPEMLALADRILVMREGRLQGELTGPEATEEAVMQLATHAAVPA